MTWIMAKDSKYENEIQVKKREEIHKKMDIKTSYDFVIGIWCTDVVLDQNNVEINC